MSQSSITTRAQTLETVLETLKLDPEIRSRIEQAIQDYNAPTRHRSELDAPISVSVDSQPRDLWTSRARPTFLYVIYAMLIWAFPIGVLATFDPMIATAITKGMTDYLVALPEPLYALFGTGYLGYATLRQWGKSKGTDQ